MNSNTSNWNDLRTRIVTAAVMVVVGMAALFVGGQWFLVLLMAASMAMLWELSLMLSPKQGVLAVILAAVGGLWGVFFYTDSILFGILSILIAPVLAVFLLHLRGATFFAYGVAIVFACLVLAIMRHNSGIAPLLWLMTIVIASDVFGYFAGRTLGGPKFWPAISPKKTWTGTIAGWIGAMSVGIAFAIFAGFQPITVLLAPFVAFAGQMGDIVESSIKRATGVKDSSNLLPGHGGVLDRFDAMLGAALFYALVVAPIGLWWPLHQ